MSRKNKKEKRSKKKSAEVFEELDNEVTEEYEETSEDASDYADNNVEADESGSYDNSEAYTTGADAADLDDEADMTDNNDTNNEASETSSNNNNSDEVSEEPDEPEEEEVKEKDLFKKHIEREAILDQIFEDNGYKKNDVIKEEREKIPYKGGGIFTLILAILGMALIGVMVYFIILNPYYIKSGEADKQLDYPELSSSTDSDELDELLKPYGATATDAEEVEE